MQARLSGRASHGYDTDEEDEGKNEIQVMKERVFGERKSARANAAPQRFGYQLNSSQLQFH
jgi:hypothetical protein